MTTALTYSSELAAFLTPDERKELDALILSDKRIWYPLPGPQSLAYYSEADVVGYGGAAGGGKTDLACGKALTQHRKVAIFRRVGTELTAIEDRFTELIGNNNGYNGQKKIWREPVPGVQIEFGSVPNVGDEKNYQGRPKDLLVLDEAANFLEGQVRFLMGWVRTVVHGQRCQVLMTFNPPTDAEGRWIVQFFAPWLDRKHPNPAKPGELRWFAVNPVNGKDIEVQSNAHFVFREGAPCYEFNPADYQPAEIIKPTSRTFIPSRITDNPYLLGTNYMSTLQAMPEPLRSQMLNGDFQAGMEDDAMQVCPTAWVEAAMARWKKPDKLEPMDGMGIDVARGGRDNTLIARRHGMWFDVPLVYKGTETPDGPTVAGLAIAAKRDNAVMHIDVIGVGASPYDFLNSNGQQVIGVNVSEAALGLDLSGRLRFKNQRTELWWRMREALDPANNTGICLPPDRQLLADLCAPKWKPQGFTIYVESREEIIERIGRSPDWAAAYCLALIETPKRVNLGKRDEAKREYDPYAQRIT